MDLTKADLRQEYIALTWFLNSRTLIDKLLDKLFKLSDEIDNSNVLTKTQFNKLAVKFREIDNDGDCKTTVKNVKEYIEGQMDKDELGTSWSKEIETKNYRYKYGQLLEFKFEDYKKEIKNNLADYLSPENQKKKNLIEKYWEQNPAKLEFKLFELVIKLFVLVEVYGKEYYNDWLAGEEKLKWQKL
ncbi:MAG: hypothetical protein ACQEP9_04000 [Bacillota bacterium]